MLRAELRPPPSPRARRIEETDVLNPRSETPMRPDATIAAVDAPVVSVVIPHYQQPPDLARALASLGAQTGAPPFEVIVVDNGSAKAPEAECALHPGVRLMLETEKGPGPARTMGARAARGAILAFLDADCMADPDWIATLHGLLTGDPSIDVLAGGVRIAPANPSGRMNAIECYEQVFSYRQKLFVERDRYAATLNMAVRRATFDEVGPFAGLSTAEDRDWGRRAAALGKRIVYAPQMRIATPARDSFAEVARKWDRQIGHDYHEARASLKGQVLWAVKALVMPVSSLAAIPEISAAEGLAGPGARIRAFAVLTRTRLWRARRMAELACGLDPAGLAAGWRK
ncbi:MAG: cellulose synthase/poly-beta-1,6-N-acetylglucosamine synthase-like glycosyltransferase [Paracoccaceae bacterium]|jgi:cellulose synthase/poly-beta-1,6-N-acetylglucosamine synthase-like glycosyltransferase